MTCLIVSQYMWLPCTFGSSEGVEFGLLYQSPVQVTASHDAHDKTWPFAFSTLTFLFIEHILLGVEDLML